MNKTSTSPLLIGRKRLADRLREIRASGGRSVRTFADLIGMAPSKASRLENGHQIPTVAELGAWARGADLDEGARRELHEELQNLRDDAMTERSINRRRFKDGQEHIQAEFNELTAAARVIRTFQPAIIPSLLQTPDYARAVLETVPAIVETPPDVEAAVAARSRRAEMLKDSSRRFEFVIWEGALLRRFGSTATMRGQLFHLSAAIGIPQIMLGIIPFAAPATVPALASLVLYDDFAVIEGVVDDPRYAGKDAEILHGYMNALWREAVEGDEARRIILAASESLRENPRQP